VVETNTTKSAGVCGKIAVEQKKDHIDEENGNWAGLGLRSGEGGFYYDQVRTDRKEKKGRAIPSRRHNT